MLSQIRSSLTHGERKQFLFVCHSVRLGGSDRAATHAHLADRDPNEVESGKGGPPKPKFTEDRGRGKRERAVQHRLRPAGGTRDDLRGGKGGRWCAAASLATLRVCGRAERRRRGKLVLCCCFPRGLARLWSS